MSGPIRVSDGTRDAVVQLLVQLPPQGMSARLCPRSAAYPCRSFKRPLLGWSWPALSRAGPFSPTAGWSSYGAGSDTAAARRAGGRKAEAKAGSGAPGWRGVAPWQWAWGLQASVAAKRAKAKPGVIEAVFERWFTEAKPGDKLVYARGSLAYEKQYNASLARLADRLLTLSNGEFEVLSPCGHSRGLIVGSRELELLTKREHGEIVYLAVRR